MKVSHYTKIPLQQQYRNQILKSQQKSGQKVNFGNIHSPDLSAGSIRSNRNQDFQIQQQFVQSRSTPKNTNDYLKMHQQIVNKQTGQKKLNNSVCRQIKQNNWQGENSGYQQPQQIHNQNQRNLSKKTQNNQVKLGLIQDTGDRVFTQTEDQNNFTEQSFVSVYSNKSFQIQSSRNKIINIENNMQGIASSKKNGRRPIVQNFQKNKNQDMHTFASGFAFKLTDNSQINAGMFSNKQFLKYRKLSENPQTYAHQILNTSRNERTPQLLTSRPKSNLNSYRETVNQMTERNKNSSRNNDSFVSELTNEDANQSLYDIVPHDLSVRNKKSEDLNYAKILVQEAKQKVNFQKRIQEAQNKKMEFQPIKKAVDLTKKFQLDSNLLSIGVQQQRTPKFSEMEQKGIQNFVIRFQ